MAPIYYRDAEGKEISDSLGILTQNFRVLICIGAVLVYDITTRESFNKVELMGILRNI